MYYLKYQKYKLKYLNLVYEQIGSGNNTDPIVNKGLSSNYDPNNLTDKQRNPPKNVSERFAEKRKKLEKEEAERAEKEAERAEKARAEKEEAERAEKARAEKEEAERAEKARAEKEAVRVKILEEKKAIDEFNSIYLQIIELYNKDEEMQEIFKNFYDYRMSEYNKLINIIKENYNKIKLISDNIQFLVNRDRPCGASYQDIINTYTIKKNCLINHNRSIKNIIIPKLDNEIREKISKYDLENIKIIKSLLNDFREKYKQFYKKENLLFDWKGKTQNSIDEELLKILSSELI